MKAFWFWVAIELTIKKGKTYVEAEKTTGSVLR
jgi:hypothetical protein